MHSDRPRIKVRKTAVDFALRLTALCIVVYQWVFLGVNYDDIRDPMPNHFDSNGNPNGYGSKDILFLFPSLSTGFFIMFVILVNYPHRFNYAGIKVTKENAEEVYKLGVRALFVILNCIVTLMAVIESFMLEAGLDAKSMNIGLMIALEIIPIFCMIISIVYLILRLKRIQDRESQLLSNE